MVKKNEKSPKIKKKKITLLIFFIFILISKQRLTFGIILVTVLAYFFPKPGAHKVTKILSKVAIGVIFFLDGIKMKTQELKKVKKKLI